MSFSLRASLKSRWWNLVHRWYEGLSQQVCQVEGVEIQVGVTSNVEIFRAQTYTTKEPETLEWLRRFVKRDEVLWDVGANIGLYALYAAKVCGARVMAFEPEAVNFARLNNNIYLNELSSKITGFNLALGLEERLGHLHLNPMSQQNEGSQGLVAGAALHQVGKGVDFSGTPFQAHHLQGVFMTSADRLIDHWGLASPHHMKIDVDGLEEEIVQGCHDMLRRESFKSLLIEVNQKQGDEGPIHRELTSLGFRVVDDFADHSSSQLQGTRYENVVNQVYVRD